jgi:serine/threonine-protein kinase
MTDETRLQELLSLWQQRRRQGEDPTAAELCQDCPELEPRLREHIYSLERMDRGPDYRTAVTRPLSDTHPKDSAGEPALPCVPGYEVLGLLGRGGMGVVYKARHLGLDRVVALKMIRGGDPGPAERGRLQAEARAVARLQHPGIVQVFEVGEHDGRPFVALEFCAGGSLADRLWGDPWPPRQAAAAVADLARAMRHAHASGVVHRDLKPGNVLLTREGALKVTDFGLAKRVDQGSDLSDTGTPLGTPSYMAPEQTRGGAKEAGPTADVWALGAVLYALLTGRPPFRGATPLETVAQVRDDEPVPPARLARVPRDLEVICLKCLEKEPGRRYATAQALADDLGRYLKGEPIRARPVGLAGRLWRWSRRHPREAALLAALVLLAAGAFAAMTALWLRAEDHLRDANDQRARAEKHSRDADEQRALAERHLGEARAQQKRADRHLALQKNLLNSYNDLSVSQTTNNQPTEAARSARQAGAILEQLAALEPDNLAYQSAWGGTLHNLAVALERQGRRAEALAAYQQAIKRQRRAYDRAPAVLQYGRFLGNHYYNRGKLRQAIGQQAEALRDYQQARAVREEVARRHPQNEDVQVGLADVYLALATWHLERKRNAAALPLLEQMAAARAGLARSAPANTDYQHKFGLSLALLGNVQIAGSQESEGLRTLERAQGVWEQLLRASPEDAAYVDALVGVHRTVGACHYKAGRASAALAALQRARDLLAPAARARPLDAKVRLTLARTYYHLGEVHGQARRPGEAVQCYEQARALLEELVGAAAGDVEPRHLLGGCLHNTGQIHEQQGRREQALAAYRQAIAHQRVAFARAPQKGVHREWLSNHHYCAGRVLRNLGRLAGAVAAFQAFAALWPREARLLYDAARELAGCAAAVGEGRAVLTAAEETERTRYADLALDTLRRAVAHGFQDARRLETDTGLDALRDRAGFQELRQELQAKTGKG